MKTRILSLFLLLCLSTPLAAQADEYSRSISKHISREDTIFYEYLRNSIINLRSEQPREVNPDTTSTAVGAMGGTFGVSATGGATYTIPIDVPQGIGGLQPQLSIVYNSQAGNGLCGYGANLSGISCITRGPKDIYHDGTAQGIQYDADDALYLDGVRLILSSGTPGQNGAEYTPESDPYTRVIVHGNCTSTYNNIYYEVRGSDGMTYWYGDDYNSHLSYTDGNGVQKRNLWYLTYAVQPSGNYIYYHNQNYDSYILPLMIAYGVNENQMSSSCSIVEFAYELRTDTVLIHFDGQSGSMNKRLKTITCRTNDEVYRSYTLNYNTTGDGTDYKYSRLTSITEKNAQNETLPSTTLNWSYLPSVSHSSNYLLVQNPENLPLGVTYNYLNKQYMAGDMNGDAIPDIIGVGPVGNETIVETFYGEEIMGELYYFTSGQTGDYGITLSSGKFMNLVDTYGKEKSITDLDGDGVNELVLCFYDGVINDYGRVVLDVFGQNIVNGRTIVNMERPYEPLVTTGDLYNDGQNKVIILETSQNVNGKYRLRVLKLNEDWGSPDEEMLELCGYPQLSFNSAPKQMYLTDMDGNGMSDLLVICEYGYKIFWNQGEGTTVFSDNASTQGFTFNNEWMRTAGDFNGDGLLDILTNNTGSSDWYFYINNGNGSFTTQLACSLGLYDQSFTTYDDDKFHCDVFDFDGDGKTDVVITKAMYYLYHEWSFFDKTHTYWMRSTGNSLEVTYHATSNRADDAYPTRYLTEDFDGDGHMELVNFGYDCKNGNNANVNPDFIIYKHSGLLPQSGRVTSVTGDYGVTTSINYSTLTDVGLYIRGTSEPYPAPRYTIPLNVVKQTSQNNGAAGSLTTRYTYEGLKVHLRGRGMLGFSKTTANCTTTGIATESGVTQWDTAHYIPKVTYAKTIIGSSQSQTTNTLTIADKGGKRYFAYPSQTVETDFDGNTVTTVRTYNTTYGYLTGDTTTYGTNMYQSVTYSDYILAGGSYHPRTVVTTQRHADDTSPFSTTTKYSYSGNGFVIRKTENQQSSDSLATCYTYDDFGNLTSQVSTGNGITTPLTTYYTYERTHRFPVRIYTSPASTVQKYTYDLWGNVLTSQDSINQSITNTVTHTYDAWGNLIHTQAPDGTETTYTRGWNNSPSQRWYILEQGTAIPWVKTWYDNCGRQVKTESVGPMNVDVGSTTTYNSKGLVSGRTDTNGNLTLSYSYTYDARGRLISEMRPGNSTVTYSYGSDGRTKTVSDNGRQTTYTYDAMGNLKTVQAPQSSTVTHTYSSNGGIKTTVSDGATWTFQYDNRGNRTSMTDPDAGTTTYTYDALGRETQRIDGRGVVFVTNYDYLGRMTTFSATQSGHTETITNTYGTSGTGQTRLVSESNGHWSKSYVYDTYGRITQETMSRNGYNTKSMSYHYNSSGLLVRRDYPNVKSVTYAYDAYGNCTTINVQNGLILWNLTANTGSSTTSTIKLNNTTPYVRTTRLDNAGNIQSRVMTRGSDTLQYDSYVFNAQTGNLTSRTMTGGSAETFAYDNLDRLTQISSGNQSTMSVTYAANGNISTKNNMGQYSYSSTTKPHAVNSISPVDGIPEYEQYIEYNPWNKAEDIYHEEGDDYYYYHIEYGPDQQRVRSSMYKNDILQYKKLYWDGYEEYLYENGNSDITVWSYWIEAPDGLAGFFWNTTAEYYTVLHPYVAMTDHLGSLTGLYDPDGNKTLDATYDAWGKRTFAAGSMQMDRGFTGHEHIDVLGLINMNGRMYDPLQGRFLSPDNYIQAPDNPQNYNRYSYCLNNPLKYTDPSGEFVWAPFLIAAAMGGVQGTMLGLQNGAEGWDMVGYIAGGAALGALSGSIAQGMAAIGANTFVAQLTSNAVTSSLGAGMMSGWDGKSMLMGLGSGLISGCVSGAISLSYDPVGLINGMLADGAVNAGIGAISGGITAAAFGGNFWDGALNGAIMGGLSGMVSGAYRGWTNASKLGVNNWTGGSLQERAQAWADYYGLPKEMFNYASQDKLDVVSQGKDYSYYSQYDGITAIRISDGKILHYKIDGLCTESRDIIFLSAKTIRHARFNTGWGKGSYFHEYYHSQNENTYRDELGAYQTGYGYGGRRYYRHCKSEMKLYGISR